MDPLAKANFFTGLQGNFTGSEAAGGEIIRSRGKLSKLMRPTLLVNKDPSLLKSFSSPELGETVGEFVVCIPRECSQNNILIFKI
jgi:hypothetical protein